MTVLDCSYYGIGHKGTNRVLRGGSWNNDARNCRSAYRNGNHPDDRNDNIGFRIARAHRRLGLAAADPTNIVSELSALIVRRKSSGARRAGRSLQKAFRKLAGWPLLSMSATIRRHHEVKVRS